MEHSDLFLSLAEIAGVFVGFGALIAVRTNATDTFDVAYLEMVVWEAVGVVIGALAPVVISLFGLTGHQVWLPCSVLVLALFWIGNLGVLPMSSEHRAALVAWPVKARARQELVGMVAWLPANVALAMVMLGVFPNQEEALYFASIALFLVLDAGILLMAVFHLGRPRSA